jgi:hypothetical protein
MKRDLSIILALVIIILAGAVLFKNYSKYSDHDAPGQKIGQSLTLQGVTITPLEVVEDSRCAEGVQCVWAGTVKVRTEIKSGLGTAIEFMEIDRPITTEAEEVTLVSVTPGTKASRTIAPSDYRFVYSVKMRTAPSGGCFVGGCSAQICSDEPNAVSTCEYSPKYACYKTAKCERQASGQCGWTETQNLTMCLKNATGETIY